MSTNELAALLVLVALVVLVASALIHRAAWHGRAESEREPEGLRRSREAQPRE